MGLKLFAKKTRETTPCAEPEPTPAAVKHAEPTKRRTVTYEPADVLPLDDDPVRRALQFERFGHLLLTRHQWVDYRDADSVYSRAVRGVDDGFGMVPEGFVSLSTSINDMPGSPEEDIDTNAFLLSRYQVTNEQFQHFVDDGGYENLDLWPSDIWPHLIDFKDQTDEAGPRYWRHGRHDKHTAQHPIVGVCCFEAAAYAKWAGYRLPTEAEWQMAASWRIRSVANVLRRYPWGDAFDISRCNVWATNVGGTSPVTDYADGAAPNGVVQLIGNVWEWCDSDFELTDERGNPVVGDMLMRVIRGGAFDTYFAAQATSTFRTGAAALTRSNNIGFRCAMDFGGTGQ